MWRFLITAFISSTMAWSAAHDPIYVLGNEPIAIEAEVAQPPKGWVLETDVPDYKGYGYLRWEAGNAYNAPGSGEIQYRILVTEPGRYQVRLRLNTKGAERSDLGNDAFTRFDDDTWVKTFVGGGSAKGWATRSKLEPKHGSFADAAYELSAGVHTYCISGRSHGLRIDRIIIWKDGLKQPGDSITSQTGLPEMPPSLTDKSVLAVWQQGGLGTVMSWAGKQKDKTLSQEVVEVLSEYANKQVAVIEGYREKNPLLGLHLLETLTAQYANSDKGRELQKVHRKWISDPLIIAEQKASDMANALLNLLSDYEKERDPKRKAAMADAINKGLVVMQKKCAGTSALTLAEQRVAAANLSK